MAAPPWFRWFPADFARDTRHLSMIERGAYRDLLDSYYQSGGKLRSDTAGLYRICGAVMPEEQAAVRQVVAEFFQDGDLGWLRNPRADIELAEQASYFAAQAANGKKGANARWHSDANGTAIAPPMAPPQSGQWPNDGHKHKQLHKQKTKAKHPLPDGFGVSPSIKVWAAANGYTRLDEHLAYFIDYVRANGKTYADWDAAFRNCIKGNWAKLTGSAPANKQDLGHYR